MPRALTVGSSRPVAARRRTAVRRRRRMVGAAAVVVAGVLAVLAAMPLFQKAIDDLTLPLHYQKVIRSEASQNRLDPALVAAVIYAETRFDARTSPAGAEGLMQIEPQTAEFLARRSGATTFTTADLGTPQVNIAYGSYYLRYLLDDYANNEVLALAAYNGGETNVNVWLAKVRSRGQPFTVRDIPFPETRAYVEKVEQAQKEYRKTYAVQLGYG